MSFKLSFVAIIIIIAFIIFSFFIDKSIIENFINNNEISSFFSDSLMPENLIELNKIYNFPTNLITLLLINYLFLTLLVTVKITKKNYGPLRPIN